MFTYHALVAVWFLVNLVAVLNNYPIIVLSCSLEQCDLYSSFLSGLPYNAGTFIFFVSGATLS